MPKERFIRSGELRTMNEELGLVLEKVHEKRVTNHLHGE
jgi:hypothetical protein